MLDSLNAYQASLSRSLYPSRITVKNPQRQFRASMDFQNFGRLIVVKAYANAPFVLEPLSHWTNREDSYVLHLQLAGEAAYLHCSGEVPCSTNTLLLTNTQNVVLAEQKSEADAIVVKIPGKMLRERFQHAEGFCWVATNASSGAAEILRSFLLDLWKWNASLGNRERELMSLSLLNLIEAAFRQDDASEHQLSAGHERLHQRLRHEIASRLSDPDLKNTDLAVAMGMSRSKLYRMTRDLGTTVERLIIETRLDHVARQLETRQKDEATLTALAFEFGFNDMSHFSRCFKRRFGTSPSVYRKSATNHDNAPSNCTPHP